MNQFFKSLIDQDPNPIVLCDVNHIIRYMNPAAVANYEKYGGKALLGKSVMGCHKPASREEIGKVVAWFAEKKENNRVHTMFVEQDALDVYMIALRDEEGELIGYYEQQIFRTPDDTPLYQMR